MKADWIRQDKNLLLKSYCNTGPVLKALQCSPMKALQPELVWNGVQPSFHVNVRNHQNSFHIMSIHLQLETVYK